MSEAVKLEREGEIARVVLHRPEVLNALDLDLAQGLVDAVEAAALAGEIRVVVVTGEGRGFCAGGDLGWALRQPDGAAAAIHRLAGTFHRAVTQIRRMGKPVVAAVNGVAAGAGFSLALACDFRVMARGAVLRQAYSSAGLCIDGGGTFTLPRLVGAARALEIAALDPTIGAEQALEWGLVHRLADAGEAMAAALALAADLLQRSTSSFAASKALLDRAYQTSLEEQLEREREAIVACAASADGQEGIRAFTEKRRPVFGQAPQP
jgi:2-(1,2-epoxy-1,2-dihydrophenyl)acetyl-CoA isomerase